ncbi:helix-turn-helix transcriptional regulator [Longispora sp. K20-0274]|uniref:helix-turn-helix domain-containing protein n=1 Tax=Longispora sp. K20-0274 TaxID=3088255 RepID=UPI00399A3CB9
MMSTTPEGSGSTVPRRQLGRRLRALRTERGLRADEVSAAIDVSRQSLWRMENGDSSVKYGRSHIEALCRLYKVDEATRDGLVSLAAETKNKGWWHAFSDVLMEKYEIYVSLEAAASRMRWFNAQLVLGLFQTPDYARQIIGAKYSGEELERLIEVRMARQAILTRTSPPALQLDAVLDEAVLHRPIGNPALMAAQLRHLVRMSHLPNVSIRIVPFAFGMHAGLNTAAFSILDFPEGPQGNREPSVVMRDGFTGDLYLDRPAEVGEFSEAFDDIVDRSLNVADSRMLLERMAKEFD